MRHVYIVWAIDDTDYDGDSPRIVDVYIDETKASERADRLTKRLPMFKARWCVVRELTDPAEFCESSRKLERQYSDVRPWRGFDRFEVEKVAVRQ